ncbi:MAG TPA: DUF1801 domain-containing protein [Bacteroidetes bacterium]|nr:DUF1801 domain-containing protein [Bacteroidota bacterium]
MRQEIDQFYMDKPEPLRGCLLALRDLILVAHPDLKEAWKYRMPCFTFRGKQFCYLWIDKHSGHPYILMVDGGLLTHPALLQGDRKRMKVLNVNLNEDLPLENINEVLAMGISLRESKT